MVEHAKYPPCTDSERTDHEGDVYLPSPINPYMWIVAVGAAVAILNLRCTIPTTSTYSILETHVVLRTAQQLFMH